MNAILPIYHSGCAADAPPARRSIVIGVFDIRSALELDPDLVAVLTKNYMISFVETRLNEVNLKNPDPANLLSFQLLLFFLSGLVTVKRKMNQNVSCEYFANIFTNKLFRSIHWKMTKLETGYKLLEMKLEILEMMLKLKIHKCKLFWLCNSWKFSNYCSFPTLIWFQIRSCVCWFALHFYYMNMKRM